MSIDLFAVEVRRVIKAKVSDLERHLGQGKAVSYEEYKLMAGRIRGLEEGLGLFQDTLRKYADIEEGDDDER